MSLRGRTKYPRKSPHVPGALPGTDNDYTRDEAPVEEYGSVDEAPVEEYGSDEAPVEEYGSVDEAPVEEYGSDEAPVEEYPSAGTGGDCTWDATWRSPHAPWW